ARTAAQAQPRSAPPRAPAQGDRAGRGAKHLRWRGWRAAAPIPSPLAIARIHEQATFNYSFGQLLNEQRHTIGTIDDLVGNFSGQRLPTDHTTNHFGALPPEQTVKAEQGHVRAADPGWRKLRPERDEQQDRQR